MKARYNILTLYILTFLLFFTLPSFAIDNIDGNWSDNKATGYASGSGTQTDPYIIKTAEQLAYFAAQVTAGNDKSTYVELGADIDLDGHWWQPIGARGGSDAKGFEGTFDGKGYAIKNLSCKWGDEDNSGLFSFLRSKSVVRNVIIDNAKFQNVSGNLNNGGIRVGVLAAATKESPSIENIIIKNSEITVEKENSAVQGSKWVLVGGLVGGAYNTPTIKNIYLDVDIDLSKITQYANGSGQYGNALANVWYAHVLGGAEGSSQPKIENVYSTGTLKVNDNLDFKCLGTIVGSNGASTPSTVVGENCYYKNLPTYGTDNNTVSNVITTNNGTQKTADDFYTTFKDIANKYVDTNEALLKWGDNLSFKKVKVAITESWSNPNKYATYELEVTGTDSAPTTVQWTLNGESKPENKNKEEIELPLSNTERTLTATVTVDGETMECAYTIKPKKYSEDLYATVGYAGSGTKADPYKIDNDLQLALLARNINKGTLTTNGNTYIELANDINLSAALWMPIGGWKYEHPFTGKFDGKGHVVSNMRMLYEMSGWCTWGLFADVVGSAATEDGFAIVTNLIIDNAKVEKMPNQTSNKDGINIGILAGEVEPYSEISNIIVRNSTITDNGEKYTATKADFQVGGIIGNVKIVDKDKNTKVHRVFNLMADVTINLFKYASITGEQNYIGGAIGRFNATDNQKENIIFPKNIYVNGGSIDTNATVQYLGVIFGYINQPTAEQSKTWYRSYDLTASNANNHGSLKENTADFAQEFIRQSNFYIQETQMFGDKVLWAYDNATGSLCLGTKLVELSVARGTADVITVVNSTTEEQDTDQYNWYVSTDKENWKLMVTSSTSYTLPRKAYNQYVYATNSTVSTPYKMVEAITVTATLNKAKTPYEINISTNIDEWKGQLENYLTISYQWVENDNNVEGATSSTYTPTTEGAKKVGCHIVVSYNQGENTITLLDKWLYAVTEVYLCPAEYTLSNGTVTGQDNDANDWGYSPEKPMKTWKGAYSKLSINGSWDENVIVLMGKSSPAVTNDIITGFNITNNYQGNVILTATEWNNATSNSPLLRNTTITGKSQDGVDYNGVIEFGEKGDAWGLPIWGDTRFKNITFNRVGENGENAYNILYCQYNNLEMGKGIKMTGYKTNSPGYGTIDGAGTTSFQIFGGLHNDGRFVDGGDITFNDNFQKWKAAMPHGQKGFSITLYSGFYSCICAGGRITYKGALNGLMGTPDTPVKCTITMDIDRMTNEANYDHKTENTDYDAGIILAGNHEGAMIGDVDIVIKSGRVARVVNGSLGNIREYATLPENTYMGRANIHLDPASSNNNLSEDVNERVIVTEMYGGSTGRGFTGGKGMEIDNPFYGYSTITVNGGTFKILPQNNEGNMNILCGIFGAGAGGTNGIGNDSHHTEDQKIPYWNDSHQLSFGNYAIAHSKLAKFTCYNADGTETEVDPAKTNTKITINGGVFGSTPNTDFDGIYACGSGYMSPSLWTDKSNKPSSKGGNFYGKNGETVASLTINNGTFYCKNGIFAGGRGTDLYYSDKDFTYGADKETDIYTALGQTYGNVELNINGGKFHCRVFGGGYGTADAKSKVTQETNTLDEMARIYGKSTVNITGGTFYDNIYGGGDMAVVDNPDDDATNLVISGNPMIYGYVFAGGNGKSSSETKSPELVGKVNGNTNVTFLGSANNAPTVYGDIYGGGNLAQVSKDTHINIYAGNFAGEIFGGGNGNIETTPITSADVQGNTYVTLAKDNGGQEDGNDGEKVDNFSINVIWDKKWDKKQAQVVYWNSTSETEDENFFERIDGILRFVQPHNIYGGGNNACVVTGTANVKVYKGMTPYSLLKTQQWKESYNDNKNPHFSVFGGGYGPNTKVDNTNVEVNIEGDYGIYNAEVDDDTDQLSKWSPVTTYNYASRNKARATQQSEEKKVSVPVFDNSKGIPNFTVHSVFGGGYAGTVTKNTKVTVDGNTFIHRVYGGGFGDPDAETAEDRTGEVTGNTEVYVKGANIYGDVFGGGAGVNPKGDVYFIHVARVTGTTKVNVSDDAKVFGNVYGGGDVANVGPESYTADYTKQPTSETDIDPENGTPKDNTSYTADNYSSFVNIVGGDIYGEVFGGGKGLKKAYATDYDQVGRISGNTLVHIANTYADDSFSTTAFDYEGNNIPYVWNRIYGGCAYGTVNGNTLVHIEGGMLGLNIFGGGYGDVDIIDDMTGENPGESTDISTLKQVLGKVDTGGTGTYADILGNTKVQIDGGTWIWNRKADTNGNIKTWLAVKSDAEKICNTLDEFKQIAYDIVNANSVSDLTNTQAKVAIERILADESTKEFFTLDKNSIKSGSFKKNHNIFGGGNRACKVSGDAVVEINHSPLADIIDQNGRALSLFDYTTLQGLCWYLASKNVSYPQFSVFGAGYGANTEVNNAYVYAQPGAIIDSNGEPYEIKGKKYRYINQEKDKLAYQAYETQLYNDFNNVPKIDLRQYYGMNNDEDIAATFNRYYISRMAWTHGISCFTFMEIHGGGFSGYVKGNTYVEANNQVSCNNIYGAGLGAEPYETTETTNKDDATLGTVGGDSKVFIKSGNVSQNVYGGGGGILGYKNVAMVKGKTQVHIYGEKIGETSFPLERTLIMGSVYGGGDIANVGKEQSSTDETTKTSNGKVYTSEDYKNLDYFTSFVNIRGGVILSQVFAGGKGRTVAESKDYNKFGGINGDACIVVDLPVMNYPYLAEETTSTTTEAGTVTTTSYTTTPLEPWTNEYLQHPTGGENSVYAPKLLNRVYGGCQNGSIYGNTCVVINDGKFYHNIFGGGWGDTGTSTTNSRGEQIISADDVTYANVTGNTNMFVNGGEMALTAYWLEDTRFWEPAAIDGGNTYSPQYDHKTQKFKINHNIYGGGNMACEIGGDTHLTMTKGLLKNTTQVLSGMSMTNFFESNEWKEVYNKVGSPHFSVFGAGYGEYTTVRGNTHLMIEMVERECISNDPNFNIKEEEEYKHFVSEYSVMDIVGGGYSGKVVGNTYVAGEGGGFCRRVFGGGFFNSVDATNVEIKAIDCHDVFGGGLMGNVNKSTNITIGQETTTSEQDDTNKSTFSNKDIYIHGDVYGGNDVSGYVNMEPDAKGYYYDNGGTGTNVTINGGHIYGNVYGAGNGDYLYALDRNGNTKVTVNEDYPLNPDNPNSDKVDLVYTVPMRDNMASYVAVSDAAKIVNINSYRPMTNRVSISIKGNGEKENRTFIDGDVYGGGNSATVQKVQKSGVKANVTVGEIKLNIGSHVKIRRVFMGCNGNALFMSSADNSFMNKFQKLNGDVDDHSKELNLADTIDWEKDPSNKSISTLYLPTKNEDRPTVYPHLLDLYFQPVETDIQGELTWNETENGKGLEDCEIGSFFCGGNRGNMNIYPKTEEDYAEDATDKKIGNVLEYTFPEGLTITDKIVGGCNRTNYDYNGLAYHEGGYLLGLAKSEYPFIKLNVNCKFEPTVDNGAYKGGNVYGGCYESGTIRGDITINLNSDMLYGKDKAKLEKSNEKVATDPAYSTLNVYGAGYGMDSYVYGNTDINVAEGKACDKPSETTTDGVTTFGKTGTSANFVYGGGQQGNLIGVTNVEIFNGHIFRSVTGGSYSGYVWGSTQVKVGYPTYYTVKLHQSGRYYLKRVDQNNKDIDNNVSGLASETIKQTVHLVTGDIVSQALFNDIEAKWDSVSNKKTSITESNWNTYFEKVEAKAPAIGWDNINIQIGEAVYGGGYSLAQGSSVMANNTTVLKFTDKYNLDNAFTTNAAHKAELEGLPGSTTAGFGGNTTIVIADRAEQPGDGTADRDHIAISRQDMKEVILPDGTDLYGYYYKHVDDNKNETYRYISLQDTYFYNGDTKPDGQVGNAIYEYDNEGGIFGDGHLSYAQGFRSADLTGYGYAGTTISNPKIVNTFQRMDILRLEDNCLTLLGARDYATNTTNKTPYSISRVGEIQMVANNIIEKDNGALAGYGDRRSRNYMGLANNIHYVGAVSSNVGFDDSSEPWRNGEGAVEDNDKTYRKVKQTYVDQYKNDHTEASFQKRNDGTAKNMIGIASGYALKIQGVQEKKNSTSGIIEDNIYYGPIYGVVEMNLINVRNDEGGGYVYADNIHKRDNGETPDFLETTGNFVFPYKAEEGRFIVDDCFPSGYNSLTNEEKEDPDSHVAIHYWYVTGFNYYYNANITGYTYKDSGTFYSDNSDGLTVLSGLKGGQKVEVVSWKMRSGHPTDESHKDDYSCDLEVRNYDNSDETVDMDKVKVKGLYELRVGASSSEKYDGNGFNTVLPMNGDKPVIEDKTSKLPEDLKDDAKIFFQLTDKANNSTSDYFNKHLSEKCMATLVLKAPAYKTKDDADKGIQIESHVAVSEFYTTEDGNNYNQVKNGETLQEGITYYVRNGIAEEYAEANTGNLFTRDATSNEYVSIADITDVTAGDTYYCKIPRWYTYTIYLTIEYVQGPTIEGDISIENCALPGEMIRVNKGTVNVKADQSFSPNGYYWRLGKRKKVDGKWQFVANDEWKVGTPSKYYDVFKQGDKEGTGLFAGCKYDETENHLDIPAYYYMNGYGIQLGITMSGIDDQIFTVDMSDNDCLTVHNFHRMDPQKPGIDLHLGDAVARAKEYQDDKAKTEAERKGIEEFAEPRIYISDQSDLTAFVNFVDTIGQDSKVEELRYGKYAQFVLQNDIYAPDDYTPAKVFKGIWHGNGHIIKNIGKDKALLDNNQGNIYNLGLETGMIANTNNGKYRCCFEYAPSAASALHNVYRMDGTLYDGYTTNDFKYGRVAYDLNEYYLRARYATKTNEDGKLGDADKAALQYVYDYYANGDYQYAHRSDAITGRVTGVTYLRKGLDSDIPNYGEAATRHDTSHTIDKARAQDYEPASVDSDEKNVPESRKGDYQPLFNEKGYGSNEMNDFLFWGQELQSTPEDYPSTIGGKQGADVVFVRQTNYMANRVYRAAGYYGDTKPNAYHYNAYSNAGTNMDTYVHNLKTTAIDFTCQNDANAKVELDETSNIYYPPLKDEANTYYGFMLKDGITQNLLVYTNANDEDKTAEAYDIVNKTLNYGQKQNESLIQGHHIAKTNADNAETFETALFHLVERTDDNMNGDGGKSTNNTLCVPIQFNVTDQAWYVRRPKYYANADTGAWEGICLPFTVDKAEASFNGEITHFYGNSNLHHEYWLRELDEVTTPDNGKTEAKFIRPTTGTGVDYTFNNPFFVNTYGNFLYNSDANPYYDQTHTYEGYLRLTQSKPYIVRFPGERYYEFDLSNKFYNNLFSRNLDAQTVTFYAYGSKNESTRGTVTIPVTESMESTLTNGYKLCGTFAETATASGSIYGMNSNGIAFDDNSTVSPVMPFRTYMTKTAKTANQRSVAPSIIFIAEANSSEMIVPELGGDEEAQPSGDYLIVRPIGNGRVRIESTYPTTLQAFTALGQLYRVLDVQPGSATYSGYTPGLYIFDKKKVMVR